MLPKTGWNMTKKYYLLGVSIILREWLCLIILFWDDVPRRHCIRNAKTWRSMTRMPQVSWHLNVLHSIWDRIYIVAKSSKKLAKSKAVSEQPPKEENSPFVWGTGGRNASAWTSKAVSGWSTSQRWDDPIHHKNHASPSKLTLQSFSTQHDWSNIGR